MCSCCTVKYIGIIPPLKNIVKVNRNIIGFLPTISYLESAYPAGMVQTREISVPTTVY